MTRRRITLVLLAAAAAGAAVGMLVVWVERAIDDGIRKVRL